MSHMAAQQLEHRRPSSGHPVTPSDVLRHSPRAASLASYPEFPGSPAAPDNLEQVVAPPIVENDIRLFFDYHRPTFLGNLAARKDRTDPVFFALILVVLASTLVQVPRRLMKLDKQEVESLVRRCVKVARSKMTFVYEDVTPMQSIFVIISYLEGIAHLLLGNNTAHVIATARVNQLALALRLNEESSYDLLDPIESEMRRREYWRLFQADKSTACLRARTICLRLEDAPSLRLPSEIDDEAITASGVLPQPFGLTPVISGFNIVTNLFRILNDALLLRRRKSPPSLEPVLAELQSVNDLRERVTEIVLGVPMPLQLRKAYNSRLSNPAQDWEVKLQERFLEFFELADDISHALNSFKVMQGNIHVTQHLVRPLLLQAKESLLHQMAILTHTPIHDLSGFVGQQSSEAAKDIACELLDGLNSLPVECVATNGPSLVQKVRFVAIQLMECSVSHSASTARAQKLLMQFLSVLGVIEGMYTFGRDISVEQERARTSLAGRYHRAKHVQHRNPRRVRCHDEGGN